MASGILGNQQHDGIASPEGEMSAKNRARPLLPLPENNLAKARPVLAACPQVIPSIVPKSGTTSALRLDAHCLETQPRRFARVPTHAVGVHPEHREYPRATLKLPLRLRSVNSISEEFPVTLVTRDISSTGVYFLCPKALAFGASLEIEIVLVRKPMGQGSVVLATRAHVERTEPAAVPGWYGIAASFDDVQFDRDDRVPARFLKP
jgi:PilZ domain